MDSIQKAIDEVRAGGIIIVSDDDDRENEGDFVMAAEAATSEKIAFINRYSSGIICAPLTEEARQRLALPMMSDDNTDPKQTAFTVSVDYRHGTTTGISAADRATTLRALACSTSDAGDFTRPGHIFPLLARSGGVFERNGHTEAAVDFATLARRDPVGVICEIVNDDGTMSRHAELAVLARKHRLPFVTVADLIAHRLATEELVVPLAERRVSNGHGEWILKEYRDLTAQSALHVFTTRLVPSGAPIFVFPACPHSGQGALRSCDCEKSLLRAIREIHRASGGVVIFTGRPAHCDAASEHPGPTDQIRREAALVAQILKDINGEAGHFRCSDIALATEISRFGLAMSTSGTSPLWETNTNVFPLPLNPAENYAWRLIDA